MEKSTTPTSEYHVFCDTYDMELAAKIHETEAGEHKLHVSLTKEETEKELNVSLYQEDVEAFIGYLQTIVNHIQPRN